MKRYVLFDLDGTLTDSRPGIVNSIVYCLKHFDIEVEDTESLRPWLGPPLVESMERYYGFDREKALLGVLKYREYFDEKGIFENSVYPGVREMLEALKSAGYLIYMATSKPEEAARRIAAHFELDHYFDYIGGASDDANRSEKADVISYVLSVTGVENRSEAVMVGDRKHDIIGAVENGLESIGVLYGYGDENELKKAGAGRIVKDPQELCQILLQKF